MKDYPSLVPSDLEDVLDLMRYILKERPKDISDFNNLKNIFISGRKVAKIPTGSADVVNSDRAGDFNYTPTYIYILVDNSGVAEWRRAALSTW